MINNIKEIKLTLIEISKLLAEGNYPDWGDSFTKFSDQIETDPDLVKSQISTLYGGMGSFNDIVLYKDKKPLIKENDSLDILRSQLFELIRR